MIAAVAFPGKKERAERHRSLSDCFASLSTMAFAWWEVSGDHWNRPRECSDGKQEQAGGQGFVK